MRRAARRDANEQRIITALEALRDVQGRPLVVSVRQVSAPGWPDLVLAVRGAGWMMLEAKVPGGELTPEQVDWWKATPHCGPGVVVDSPEAACEAVRAFAAGKSLDAWAWWHFAPKGTPRPAEVRR